MFGNNVKKISNFMCQKMYNYTFGVIITYRKKKGKDKICDIKVIVLF